MLNKAEPKAVSEMKPAGPPADFQAHLTALEARDLLTRVERAIDKDRELHPLVRRRSPLSGSTVA
jgi:hypothetical protein